MYAVDIAEEMLGKARQVSQATFLLTDGRSIPLSSDGVSAAFSMIVFQHFQNQGIGFEYLNEIHRVLQPGGTLMINIPTHKFPAKLPRYANYVSRGLKLATAYLRRIALRLPNDKLRRKLGAYMHGTTYDLNRLFSTCTSIGFQDVEVHMFTLPATDNNRASHFLFARKPGRR
jgi:ubiquinone/menaquinone biosynthesis C-methylase UbiE